MEEGIDTVKGKDKMKCHQDPMFVCVCMCTCDNSKIYLEMQKM